MKPFKLYKIWNTTLQMYHAFDNGKYSLLTNKKEAVEKLEALQDTYKNDETIKLQEYYAIPEQKVYAISNQLADTFNNRWEYMPPRKGEVHCRYCGKRSWWSDVLENKEEHKDYCQIHHVTGLLWYIQTSILDNME